MDFQLTEEKLAFQNAFAEFARNELAPFSKTWDSEGRLPVETLRKAATLGLGGMYAKEDIGGSSLSRLDGVLIIEQLASGCIPTTAYLTIHNMVTSVIDKYATPEIRARFGPRLVSMESLASYCLTEPDAGSDAASLKTTATKIGNQYALKGAKAFISGATVSDVYLVMARTGDNTHKGISCFLVESSTPGLRFGIPEKKLGWKCQPTAMVYFDECKIPASHLIGVEGQGFKIALNALNGGRLNIGACSIGGALTCLQLTKQYMKERKQFGLSLEEMQGLRFYFADMLTEFESARWLLYRAADAFDKSEADAPMLCAMAKRKASDVAFAICDKAMQIHGGYGYLEDYRLEQIFRDLRVHQILEGTNEIMREIIARHGLNESYEIQ